MLIGGRESQAVVSASMGRGAGKHVGEQQPSFLAHPLEHVWGPEIPGLGFHVAGGSERAARVTGLRFGGSSTRMALKSPG